MQSVSEYVSSDYDTGISTGEDLSLHDLVRDYLLEKVSEEELIHMCHCLETCDRVDKKYVMGALQTLCKTKKSHVVTEERVLRGVVRAVVCSSSADDRGFGTEVDVVHALLDSRPTHRVTILRLLCGEIKKRNDPNLQPQSEALKSAVKRWMERFKIDLQPCDLFF